MNYKHIHFLNIDSTNDYLKNSYQILDNFTFVSADYQTNGRGRNDRVWESEDNMNLLFSLLIKDKQLIEKGSFLSLMMAVSIAKAIEHYGVKNVSIKWPNDIIVNDKKICGILLEGQIPNYIVIGVGLNVNQVDFPNNLRRPATSLRNELGKCVGIKLLEERLYKMISEDFYILNKEDYLSYFNKNNYLLNKRVRVKINEQDFIGEVVGVNEDFLLQIKCDHLLLHVDSGEIEIL